jgi:FlaA1/EpsC-like NDP-sugar epimerase
VPKIPSYRIFFFAYSICPECEKKIVGIRPGEKLHEEMISYSDSFFTYDIGDYFAILPANHSWKLSDFVKKYQAKKVPQGFSYNSMSNDKWESISSLKELIKKHLDK